MKFVSKLLLLASLFAASGMLGCKGYDTITFGTYEQDNDTANGKEPISWRVLEKNDKGQYLVISEKVLDAKAFDPESNGGIRDEANIGWDKSTIRSWLNGYGVSENKQGEDFTSNSFIDTAFTAEEKAKIITPPNNAMSDKIFLLSQKEVNTYFKDSKDYAADATPYAIKKGLNVLGSSSDKSTHDGSCAEAHCIAGWWLRSSTSEWTEKVSMFGTISNHDTKNRDRHVGVRPVLWITP